MQIYSNAQKEETHTQINPHTKKGDKQGLIRHETKVIASL
jgi:hypothetical protein